MNEERYYLFTYAWIGEKQEGYGNLRVRCNGFPSNTQLKVLAKNNCHEKVSVVILGWNEFEHKDDYDSFIADELD